MTTIRAFASARDALGWVRAPLAEHVGGGPADAGDRSDAVPTVGDVLASLAAAHPAAAAVLGRCSVLVDGRRALPAERIPADAEHVDLLPPFAGG